ncbi:LOW QUALITY PROTEIN: kinase suppressor of Ras 2 [Drosophila nasuta]|uniref:LOW QUALITY PROTEIN: kinase suppressor of Ras 2 n=1 Tax=Drosophila nasuta TaxID=42062 RepID=UPI00295F258D|nr:LOW QUALITY PROTEIN: kinase suppressor of Ras 2 [Drosophila nasuta]
MSSSAAAAQLTASSVSSSSSNNNSTTTTSESNLIIIQDMIELSANHLEGLRTQCSTTATLTQQEIRCLESKLVRYFSELLLTKTRLNERIPANGLLPHHQATGSSELRQWLRVVGLSPESLASCLSRLTTLEETLQLSDEELKQLLANNPSHQLDEEMRRLTKALHNLRKCMETIESSPSGNVDPEQWHWDSWDRPHAAPTHHMHHRGSIGNIGLGGALSTSSPRAHHRQHPHSNLKAAKVTQQQQQQQQQLLTGSQLTLTLTPSPPNSPFTPSHASGTASASGTPQRTRSSATSAGATAASTTVGTPPPAKKHQTLLMQHTTSSASDSSSIVGGSSSGAEQPPRPPRNRLPTDPSPDSHSSTSSTDIYVDSVNSSSNVLLVPPSPGVAHVGMGHTIKHRFSKWFCFMATCKLCQKQMLSHGLRCIDCKYICHKSCAPHVPPSCGLPPEYVHEFRQTQVGGRWDATQLGVAGNSKASPVLRKNTLGKPQQLQQHQLQQHGDSSSPSSSCTSSTPSSPALFQQQQQQQHQQLLVSTPTGCHPKPLPALPTQQQHPQQQQQPHSQFNFPNVTITSSNACNSNASNASQTLISNETTAVGVVVASESLTNGNNNTNSAHNANSNSSNHSGSNSSNSHSHGHGNSNNNSNSNSNSCSNNSSSSNNGHIHSLTGSQVSTHSTVSQVSNVSSSGSATYTGSLVNSGSFFPRKLSNAGVDKRIPFTSEYSDTHKSNDSDKTVSLSGSASTDSDRTPVRLDSTEDGDSGQWRQNSISLKEWDIPYGDLHLLERIGQGRFGTVHRALWHGDVAVKLLNEDYLQDEHMLDSFRNEVTNFKKTRHENLVLFMGACMNPPHLAIVTSLCKGNTLYTYIHQRREKFAMNRTLLIAQQIAQGMGYLHARDIIHKDLRTKNIFIENGKVIITDFGLFSSTKLLYCDMGLGVPQNWLCYLAPELIRALQPSKPRGECLEFTCYSDVFSFGTVWYELICGEFTFKDQPAESVIWQVGRGMKQSLANLQSGRDVKDLLMLCWAYDKEQRPDFARLLSMLEHLPKKRLARSPSHPVNLSRSAESVF